MSDTDDMNTQPEARIGFRDIYRAVGESEARITSRINEAFTALDRDAKDHEARIRTIEAAVTPIAIMQEARDARLAEVAAMAQGSATIAATASADVRAMKDTQHGVLSTLSAGKQLIIVAAAGVGCASGVVALVSSVARAATP